MNARPKRKDPVCPWWLSYFLDIPVRRLIHNPDNILSSYVRPGQTAMDVGCGPGYFTLPMARMVGGTGMVIAVDLQPEMLAILRRRAERAGLLPRISLHRCGSARLGVEAPAVVPYLRKGVDFALAFAMVHEAQDPQTLLGEIAALLKPDGRLLLAEPRVHVTSDAFDETVRMARAVGLRPCAEPSIRMSRAVLLAKAGC